MKHLERLEKSKEFWFLLITAFFFFILRLPSLFEPYWYGDEGIYETIGFALRHGRMLYSGIWDNKPPLLYITYALFSGTQIWVRAFSLIVGIATILVFYALAKKLFGKGKCTYVATGAFAFFFAIPLLEGNIANAENFMLLPTITAAYLIMTIVNRHRVITLFVAGLLLAIAFLFKIVAIFDLAAFSYFFLVVNYRSAKLLINQTTRLLPFFAGFVLPIVITSLYFLFNHAFSAFLKGTFTQNVGYVGYGNQFIIPQGLLILKLLVLGVICYAIFRFKKFLSVTELFIYIWTAFALFNMFFSQRPYTHYMLVALPAISLLIGLALWTEAKTKANFLILFVVLILTITNFHFYNKTLSYYGNFLSFMTGNKSVHEYQSFFDSRTPLDYDIATYLLAYQQPKDGVFLWSNSAQIYRLINKLPPGRFTVAYHISANQETLNETKQALKKYPPKFLVIPQDSGYPFKLNGYNDFITIGQTTIYERTY